ncbi:hypothetical protein IJG14_04695 [bacterium]|nr:hypothetical protein [bacterium]
MIKEYFYNLSITIVGIVTSIFILTCIGTLFHIPVNIFYVLIPFVGGVYYLSKQSPENIDFLKQFLILLLIIMISYYISISVWDFSWDGRSSHIATAILYKNGWLPVYHNYQDYAKLCHVYCTSAFWGNCYLHLVEIIGANIYKITNLIESAKTINFIMLSCVFMYSFVVFKKFLPNKKFIPCLLTTILILNPVCICQWFTNDVDLHIYMAFSMLILTILKIEHQQYADKKDLFFFVCSSLMLAMTKFTGSMYLFIICSVYFIYLIFLKKDIKKYIKIVFIIGSLIVITGINPFYTNFRDFGHPFHPLFGKNKINIIDDSLPYGFQNMSRIEMFLRSTFSETLNSMNNCVEMPKAMRHPTELKIPFTINIKSYFNYYYCADIRVNGLGYYWSGILLLSLLYLPFIRFRNKNEKYIFWLITSVVLLTTFANPHCWWARYIPQFWLFPLFIIFFGLLQNDFNNKSSKILKLILLYLMTLVYIANSLIVIQQNSLYSLYASEKLKKPFYYIYSIIKPQDKIYVMIRPEWKNMIIGDETIIPHLEENFGKQNIIFVPYNEEQIIKEKYFPLQYMFKIRRQCFFVKIDK